MTEAETAYDAWAREYGPSLGGSGWWICEVDGRTEVAEAELVQGYVYGHRPYELQAIAEEDVFKDDDAAWRHVLACERAGHSEARAALNFLREHSPFEYAAIRRVEERVPK